MYPDQHKGRVEAYIEREGLTGDDLTVAAEEIEKAGMTLSRCHGTASPKGLLELIAEYIREECMAFAMPEQKPDRRDYDDETETARDAAIRALGHDQKL